MKLSLRVSANVSESPKFARHVAAVHNPLNLNHGGIREIIIKTQQAQLHLQHYWCSAGAGNYGRNGMDVVEF